MTWVKLDDQFPDHPKALACTAEAMWLHICGLCWCARHLTDGRIPRNAVPRLAVVKKPYDCAAELVAAGIWLEVDGGFEVHDYLKFQPSKSQVESQRQSQRDRQRDSRARRGVSASTPTRPDPTRTDKTKDDDHLDVVEPAVSSSGDADRDVWKAYALLVAEAEAEPPSNLKQFLSAVARYAKRERHRRLAEYLRVCPTASPETLARWLYDDIDPVHIERPELDESFTPASELRVIA